MRILAITVGYSMAAMIFSGRRTEDSCAQAPSAGHAPGSSEVLVALIWTCS